MVNLPRQTAFLYSLILIIRFYLHERSEKDAGHVPNVTHSEFFNKKVEVFTCALSNSDFDDNDCNE